jgi:FtsP/CotA-like multicopper oxidase with cupredoxin domain
VEPPNLYSQHGALRVDLTYNTATDADGRTLYCFTTPNGEESPTLHVRPGDTLIVNVKNNLPAPTPVSSMAMTTAMRTNGGEICGAPVMDASSVNIHYHGTNTPPTCHSDEVIRTLINSGQTFTYNIRIPADEPPGLYWYHPHVHGISEAAVQGGASGAIVVDGIQNVQPAVAGLPERVLVVRDQVLPNDLDDKPGAPAWDVSVNYVPILFPGYIPATLSIKPNQKQFWRVVNASADTTLRLQLQYDSAPQVLQLVALDGVPVDSQNATAPGKMIPKTDILVPPAGRAEFIMTGPSMAVKDARLLTLAVDTGLDGDNHPKRPLIAIHASPTAPDPSAAQPPVTSTPGRQRFESLASAKVDRARSLYFSEDNPNSKFFVTVDGATPVLFNPDNPPAIVTTQGSVEEWTIQNRSRENHNFHIHQVHFLVMERNGVPVPPQDRQMMDTIDIPYWSGSGPYPSVKLRLDFRGAEIGDFVYHCHILEHEDGGMMATIRVLPRAGLPRTTDTGKTVEPPSKDTGAKARTADGKSIKQ